ncbi:hypothetical protein AB0C52_24085 [Streptomyces sp. NPDC048717]|uniref:hypothetical protein n=1 Tax=Streptomyces sp. NPDC048717 TaxID=3154928 RepID=UPI00342798FF
MHNLSELDGSWSPIAAPVTAKAAYTVTITGPVAHQISDSHDVQLGVAPRLIRPMLHDLIATGSWYQRRGEYMLRDRDCHGYHWSGDLTRIRLYQAGHPDRECPYSVKPLKPGVKSWLGHYADAETPPRRAQNLWRPVLRRAAETDVTLLRPALDYYARLRFGHNGLTPANLADVLCAMADAAPAVLNAWMRGSQLVTDPHGLGWQLLPPSAPSRKACVSGVYPASGHAADRYAEQRASQAPSSSSLAHRRSDLRPW